MVTSSDLTPRRGESCGESAASYRRPGHLRVVVDNRRDMSNKIIKFYNRWLYDMESKLRGRLETLKDDLRSDDEETRNQATEEADEILNWLYLPPKALSEEDQLQRVEAALKDEQVSAKDRLAAVRRAGRSTGRTRGRPRTETAQQAIRALSLHYATTLSWREIALDVRGCKHKRPNLERSCPACGDAIREAAGRLEKFLKSIGYDFDFPPGRELDAGSRLELLQLWQPKK